MTTKKARKLNLRPARHLTAVTYTQLDFQEHTETDQSAPPEMLRLRSIDCNAR
jgi:hypothetical protein